MPLKMFILLSFKCGFLTALFGGVGMIVGQYLFPVNHHLFHHGLWLGLLLSGMTVGMLVACLPIGFILGTYLNHHDKWWKRVLIHGVSWVFMISGMFWAGEYAASHYDLTTGLANWLILNAFMIVGMGCGAALGYFISLSLCQYFSNKPMKLAQPILFNE